MLIEHLESIGIDTINQIIVTHSDADHIGGIAAIVQSEYIKVNTIYVNPDSTKDTAKWQEFKIALQDAHENKGVKILAASTSCTLSSIDLQIDILAPGVKWSLTAPGGKLPNGEKVTSNGMSVVVKITHEGHPVALLCGDMEGESLSDILSRGVDVRADILLYPHHGGYVSTGNTTKRESDLDAFSVGLLSKVQPRLVMFSIGRGMHSTPRPIVIQRIREANSNCAICCTQLSMHCCSDALPQGPSHLKNLPSKGRESDRCCAGSIEIEIAGSRTFDLLDLSTHSLFVDSFGDKPLCRQAN